MFKVNKKKHLKDASDESIPKLFYQREYIMHKKTFAKVTQ